MIRVVLYFYFAVNAAAGMPAALIAPSRAVCLPFHPSPYPTARSEGGRGRRRPTVGRQWRRRPRHTRNHTPPHHVTERGRHTCAAPHPAKARQSRPAFPSRSASGWRSVKSSASTRTAALSSPSPHLHSTALEPSPFPSDGGRITRPRTAIAFGTAADTSWVSRKNSHPHTRRGCARARARDATTISPPSANSSAAFGATRRRRSIRPGMRPSPTRRRPRAPRSAAGRRSTAAAARDRVWPAMRPPRVSCAPRRRPSP